MIYKINCGFFDLREGKKQKTIFFREKNKRTNFSFGTPQICSFVLLSELIRIIRINPD